MLKFKKNPWLMLTVASLLSYLLFGLFDSLKGSTLSNLLEDMNFNYSIGGTIVMGQYAGYFAATFLAGFLTDYCGQKAALVFAGICMSLGVTGYSFSSAMPLLIIFIFLMGMGLGALELVGCNIITECYPDKKGGYLSILTAIAGLGAILSPAIAGYMLNAGLSWRMVYRYGLLILVPATIYFCFINESAKLKAMRKKAKSQKENEAFGIRGSFSQKGILLMYLVNFSYMAAEMGVATWMVDFYRKEKLFSIADSSRFLSMFYIGITLGRLLGSVFVDRIGRRRCVLIASAAAFICMFLGIFGSSLFVICAALTGLFYSIIFPAGTAIISSLPHGDSARIQGIYFACGGLGGMFGPWIMGIVSDFMGISWGMALGCVFCAGIFLPILLLKQQDGKL
ncbi:MFS transporter [Lachnospiraceae bacterium]|uniref:MFS transporter n=1 Tax=Extibacter sp. GGCC_0201 TaxID=2731209 RepID=UPI001AA132D5|nr:MFS transporter [Extibacter sp. GGCC_0201]MBO1719590.1 MFS transporter [Extibacter sp. GGCC_0201]BDF33915.1 MFS transporter [Lachnospiraceae bacterium]BDF37919.1 MFS transporter [Lachnospiraceae bacterium]